MYGSLVLIAVCSRPCIGVCGAGLVCLAGYGPSRTYFSGTGTVRGYVFVLFYGSAVTVTGVSNGFRTGTVGVHVVGLIVCMSVTGTAVTNVVGTGTVGIDVVGLSVGMSFTGNVGTVVGGTGPVGVDC